MTSFVPAIDIPAWFFGLLAAGLVGWVLWNYVIKRDIARSRIKRDIDHYLLTQVPEDDAQAGNKLEVQLLAAGLDLGENAAMKFNLVRLGLAAVATVLALSLGLPGLIALVAGVAAYLAPQWWLNSREKGQAQAIDRDMPTAYTRIASILNTQPNVGEMLREVAETLSVEDPNNALVLELRRTSMDIKTRGAQTALKALEERAPTPSLASLALQLRIFEETGGQFTDNLAAAAERSRAIIQGRNKARSKAAEAMMAIKMLPLLLVFVTIGLSNDPEFAYFYSTTLGQIVLVGVGTMMFLGYNVAQSIVSERG